MNSTQKTCATCSSFDAVHGCWGLVNRARAAGASQDRSRSPGPDHCCKNHHTQEESDARDAALYALWQPLLIKSRWARTRERKGMQ